MWHSDGFDNFLTPSHIEELSRAKHSVCRGVVPPLSASVNYFFLLPGPNTGQKHLKEGMADFSLASEEMLSIILSGKAQRQAWRLIDSHIGFPVGKQEEVAPGAWHRSPQPWVVP